MHAPPHGSPVVQTIVGVQWELGSHGLSSPIVQGVTGGGVQGGGMVGDEGGGVVGAPSIHWPFHGCPHAEVMVGVQWDDGRQGRSSPMVHGVTGGGVQMSMQRPPQGFPVTQGIVGVQVHDVPAVCRAEHGLSFPMVHGTVYLGGGGVVVMGVLAVALTRRGSERSTKSSMVVDCLLIGVGMYSPRYSDDSR